LRCNVRNVFRPRLSYREGEGTHAGEANGLTSTP
jgi:hypothetical protein